MKKLIATLSVAVLFVPFAAFASTVTTSATGGTSISPSGSVNVPVGVTQTFSIGASSGFSISDVAVDGVSQGAVSGVNITGDAFDHTIDAVGSAISAPISSATQPYCSGPMAPGWQNGVDGGGCGGTGHTVPAGSEGCPWFMVGGCLVR